MHLDSTQLQLTPYKGGIALTGPSLDFVNSHFPHTSSLTPHITLLSANEYKSLSKPPLTSIHIPLQHIYILGEGTSRGGDVEWLVVVWNHADEWRRKMGLGKKDYHVTLTEVDDHNARKGIGSLRMGEAELVEKVEGFGVDGMDHVVVACQSASPPLARTISERTISLHPSSFKGYMRLAEALSSSPSPDPKLASLTYAQAARLNPDLDERVAKKLGKMSDLCSGGPTITAEERDRIPSELREHLLAPWPPTLFPQLHTHLWLHPTTSRDRQLYLTSELPRFFSYLYPNRLAGMSTPRSEVDITTLTSMGFTHILTLTKETPLPAEWFWNRRVENLFVGVENYGAPTREEMDVIYERVREGGKWVVHCGGGMGRAGTVLACLIAMFGSGAVDIGSDEGAGREPRLDGQTAITLLRRARPRSLESEVQEKFVTSWVSHRWKIAHAQEVYTEPVTMLQQVHAPGASSWDLAIPTVLFLIGKPGSGKSYLSSCILKRRPKGKTIIISQDDSGSRASCERALSQSQDYGDDVLVILDRCNPSREDRKVWLALTPRRVVAVYFDYSKELCRRRIDCRLSHPTIRAGRGTNALDQMDKQNEPPVLAEGFASILTITSFAAAKQAIQLLTPAPALLKFPRTPHLLNLGASTSDDLVSSEDFDTLTGHLTIEEKIDGANMGISLSFDGAIGVQNRSHWVSSADHVQFKPLDRWVEEHEEALRGILERDEQFPERYILYGEWMVARHSIHYTHLPDRFIAFDLYDRLEDTFVSRSVLSGILEETGMSQVPLLAAVESISKVEVLQMLKQKSAYSDATVEGVYVRFEDERRKVTDDRGKVVRGDFIAGNPHWAQGNITMNALGGTRDMAI